MPIDQLPIIAVPHWLTDLSPTTIRNGEFPLHGLLRDSLYYPCSSIDGDPVMHLAGNIVSFVYVDCNIDCETFKNELRNRGFYGYKCLESRSVTKRELAPHGWPPSVWVKPFFCIWSVFERQERLSADHGPSRFSLLYICADGEATFRAIYRTNAIAPRAVAVIQPGPDLTRNGTDFWNPDGIFARSVCHNPVGPPEVLLYGAFGDYCQLYQEYQEPCWPDYQTNLYFYRKYNPSGYSQDGCVGIWSQDPR